LFPSRIILGVLGVLILGLFLAGPRSQAQPDKKPPKVDEKQGMAELLQKAEEEYRLYFKRPEKVAEFWAAVRFEIGLGKFDLAALHLKRLLGKEPKEEVDKELLKIEEVQGLSAFLKFQTIKKWSDVPNFQKEAEKNVDLLIQRVTAALDKHLSDPVRINKFIQNLNAETVEERAYAFVQLDRSRARAASYLIHTLKQTRQSDALYGRIVEAMIRLNREVVPAFLEVLKARNLKDAQAPELRLTLMDILRRRADKRAIPYLWHLSAAPIYPAEIQAKAKTTLSFLLQTPVGELQPVKMALTELAERYYRHKVKFADPKGVKIWPWNGKDLAATPVLLTAPQAEELYGLRYAREALDLDPAYKPAQRVFLNLTLDHTFAFEPDQFFVQKRPRDLKNLLATVDSDLLMSTLDRGLAENNLQVILPTVEALGARGEVRAARLSNGGQPFGLAKALFYPDRRVQFAAVQAMLRLPGTKVPVASQRIVDLLRRFLAAEAQPKALVAFVPKDKSAEMRKLIKGIGFEPVLVSSIKEAFENLNGSADFDFILVSSGAGKELPFALSQFRGDQDSGRLPVLILADKKQRERLQLLTKGQRYTWILPEVLTAMPDDLRNEIDLRIKETAGAKLSAKERQYFTRQSLDYLWRMARGEIAGYDIRPAQDALVKVLTSPNLAVQAIEVLGRLPGNDAQQSLAALALDPALGKVRLTAAMELNRHIQKNGVVLQNQQIKNLRAAFNDPKESPEMRAQLALVIGNLRPRPAVTGTRLFEFQPEPPAPPEKKEK
jgi:hypothetical protein